MNAIDRVRLRLQQGAQDPEVQLEELLLDVNEQIVARMRAEDLRRSELAERLGTSRAFVTKVLDGSENLTLKTLVRVANALEMKVELRLRPREPVRKRRPSAAKAPAKPRAATKPRRRTRPAARAGKAGATRPASRRIAAMR